MENIGLTTAEATQRNHQLLKQLISVMTPASLASSVEFCVDLAQKACRTSELICYQQWAHSDVFVPARGLELQVKKPFVLKVSILR